MQRKYPTKKGVIYNQATTANLFGAVFVPHSGGGQTVCFQGFQECTVFAQQTVPRTVFLGQIFNPIFALMSMV